MPQRPLENPPDLPAYGEAVAQWRLQLRTEVKRASSLPTSMFDACDPMLETRLAETTEAMLARLHEPDAAMSAPRDDGEKRLEQVAADELALLPGRLGDGHDARPLGIDDDLAAEYLGVLTDTCASATGAARDGAAHLLVRDFDVDPNVDLATSAAQIAAALQDERTADLDQICARVAAAIAVAQQQQQQREDRQPTPPTRPGAGGDVP